MNDAHVLARGPIAIRLAHFKADERDATHRDEIDRLWAGGRARRAGLRDGKILSVEWWAPRSEGAEVTVRERPYRSYLAQRVGLELGIRPIGVSGACEVATGRWLAGRRSLDVTDYPGQWELVPSGSLEPRLIEPIAQLRIELAEEAGIATSVPAAAESLGLVVDDQGIFDVVVHLRFQTPPAWTMTSNAEYDDLVDLDRGQIEQLIVEGRTVPTVAAVLALLPT
jgi:hypothetical protein